MTVQDDKREKQMVDRFNLKVADDRKRSDIDAYLQLDGHTISFELKSATTKGVSTVRDLGPGHFAKWKHIHWLFGVYDSKGERLLHAYYASPEDMAPWISEKARYVLPDISLAEHAASGISAASVVDLLGEKEYYTRDEAKWIMKNQWTAERYAAEADVTIGKVKAYSLTRMVELMQARCRYVMARGATLNNPHIPMSYIQNLARIDDEEAMTLRDLIRDYLSKTAITEDATA